MWPPGRTSTFLRISSLSRLNKSAEKIHICFICIFLRVYLLDSFSIRMQEVWWQYMSLIILKSFLNMSRFLSSSNGSLYFIDFLCEIYKTQVRVFVLLFVFYSICIVLSDDILCLNIAFLVPVYSNNPHCSCNIAGLFLRRDLFIRIQIIIIF